jgi:L-amino acid N-acyltransferase YncA
MGLVLNEDSQGSDHLDSVSTSPDSQESQTFELPIPLTEPKRKFVQQWSIRCPREEVHNLSTDCGLECPTLVSRNWAEYPKIESLSRDEFWQMTKMGFVIRDNEAFYPSSKNDTPWWDDMLVHHAGGPYLGPFGAAPNSPGVSVQDMRARGVEKQQKEEQTKELEKDGPKEEEHSGQIKEQDKEHSDTPDQDLWNRPAPVQSPAWGVDRHLPDPVKTKPDINIYVRNGHPSDFEDSLRIYNDLVKRTWSTLDSVRLSEEDWNMRLDRLTSKNLPWMVAATPKNSKVVGFAFVDDMGTRPGYMNLSAGIEVYVDRNHQQQGVGKALLDQLLHRVEHNYKRTCQVKVLHGHGRRQAGEIIRYKSIQRLIAQVPYQAEDQDDLERMTWMEKWLRGFGFEKHGDIPSAICRKGKL